MKRRNIGQKGTRVDSVLRVCMMTDIIMRFIDLLVN